MNIKKTCIFLLAIVSISTSSASQSKGLEEASLKEALVRHKTRNLDSLIYYAELCLKKFPEDDEEIHLELGEGYLNFNQYDKAKSILDTLSINENLEEVLFIRSLIAKGKILNHKKKNEEALEMLYQALEQSNYDDSRLLEAEIYFEIAGILRENNDLKGCTEYYRFAAQKARMNEDIDLEVRSNIQMCKVYNGWVTVNLDTSVFYGEKAIEIAKKANYEFGYASALSVAAAPIIRKGDVQRGLQMSKEALKYADKYNFQSKQKYYLILNQGFAFESMKHYDSALFYMESAASLRPKSLDHHRLKYVILKSQKRFEEALAAHEEYKNLLDSTLRRRNESNLSLAQARYENDLKEKEVTSLSQQASIQALEIKQKNQAILIGIVAILFVLMGIFFLYKQRETQKQQSQTELEQRFLRSQLNPHFISNALVAVQSFMLKNDSESAALYLTKFSKLMREILENSRREFIPVEEEINMLKNYLDIHKLRLGTFDYSIEIDDDIDLESDTIPPMFVQPFVENAVEHGISSLKVGGKIDLKFKKEDDYIFISVEDNGGGLLQETSRNHTSLSTTIIQDRMKLFNRTLKKKIQLVVENLKTENEEVKGTKVELKVPFVMN